MIYIKRYAKFALKKLRLLRFRLGFGAPCSRAFGFDRGMPIDRYYIERFLLANQDLIRGDVLEIADSCYTRKFGGDRVTTAHVLHASGHANRDATIIGDLVTGEGIPLDAFDSVILTQTLPFIYDARAAIKTCYRALKPGGVILATMAGISQISRYDMERWGDYWRFTDLSASRVFAEAFGADNVVVETYGNVYVAAAFLYGLATEDIMASSLNRNDPDYQLLISVIARKAMVS